jgi:hypothetical protein
MRDSVLAANNPLEAEAATTTTISDAQAGDDTPGGVSVLFNLFIRVLWVLTLLVGLCAISFPYFFPQWADDNKDALKDLSIAVNTSHFIQTAKSVDWERAFSKVSLESLRYVGTGMHPVLRKNPGLKEGTFYNGKGFMMKTYVREGEFLKFAGDIPKDRVLEVGLLQPAVDVEHDDAQAYCQAQGGRLPYAEEIDLSLYWAKRFSKKKGGIITWLKPNLAFHITPKFALWTLDRQGDDYTTRDNFLAYVPGASKHEFRDDGDDSENLSFLCFLPERKK